MGTYLAVGVRVKMSVQKDELTESKVTPEQLVKSYYEGPDAELWEYHEENNVVKILLKPSLLQSQLYGFLDAQFDLMNLRNLDKKEAEETLHSVHACKSYEEILDFAESGRSPFLQRSRNMDYYYLNEWRSQYIRIYYEMLIFLMEGKVMMESYKTAFEYLTSLLRNQRDKFSIAGALEVAIIG